MCGDATSQDDVTRLMDGKNATLCFADPPYGMKKQNEGVLNDNLNYSDLLEFNRQWIPLSLDALTDIGSWYCWGHDRPLMEIWAHILAPMEKTRPLTFRNLITWDKGNGQGQNSDNTRSYAIASEKCLLVMLGRQVMSTNSDNYWDGWEPLRTYFDEERQKMGWKNSDMDRICGTNALAKKWTRKSQFTLPTRQKYEMLQDASGGKAYTMPYDDLKREYETLKREYSERKREYDENCRAYFNNTHDNMNDIWHFNRAKDYERFHPTTKPYEVCARAIKSSSRPGDIVLDPFAGGGSTLMACEKLDRTCYTMELSPDWVKVILKRYEDETGDKPVLLF